MDPVRHRPAIDRIRGQTRRSRRQHRPLRRPTSSSTTAPPDQPTTWKLHVNVRYDGEDSPEVAELLAPVGQALEAVDSP